MKAYDEFVAGFVPFLSNRDNYAKQNEPIQELELELFWATFIKNSKPDKKKC